MTTGLSRRKRRAQVPGFSPLNLFANGEVGVWYDPSDLTPEKLAWVAANPGFTSAQFLAAFPTHTLYTTSTGTTPVTALGQPVGLVLDKSQGALSNLGPELVTNGDFSNGTTSWGTFNCSIAVSNGELVVTSNTNAAFPQATQTISGLTTGRVYAMTGTIRRGTTTSPVFISPVSGTSIQSSEVVGTSVRVMFTATGTTSAIGVGIFSATANGTAIFDNISVREIPGNHARQTTDAARPTLQARVNLLTGTTTLATQTLAVLAAQHTLSFTGTGTVTLSGTSTAGPLVGTGANDRVSLTFTPTAGNLTLTVSGTVTDAQLERNSAFTTYQRVTTATNYADIGLPRALTFDGTDDSLVTAGNVNFSGTDKMTVCAGVFKQTDAAAAIVVELTASSGTGSAFAILAPSGAAPTYQFRSIGTVDSNETVSGYAAPITNVVTMSSDIGGDILLARINAIQVVNRTTDQGTGNYSNAQLFFGSRNQASLRFNGRIHQLIVRGAATDSVTIQQTERFVAQKTGVVI